MATSSYLSDVAGGVVVAAAFEDEGAAVPALDILRSSGVRWQDISVVARDRAVAERIAGDRAWTPFRRDGRLPILGRFFGSRVPKEIRSRFGLALGRGQVVIAVAADGQPADTLAALFAQAHADRSDRWWQGPGTLFAPPELAGPF